MIKAILTDIEGTASSSRFIQEVLAPYTRERMKSFIREHSNDSTVSRLIEDLRRNLGQELDDEAVVEQALRHLDEGVRQSSLNALQCLVWEDGYLREQFKGHVYEDALRNLSNWRQRGLKVYGFSAGTADGQKLLFGHSEYGDVSAIFDEFFDTTVGSKEDPTAYQSIATSIGLSPAEVLYIADSQEELDAARQVGMYTVWVVREGGFDAQATHRQVRSFDDIEP